MQMHTEEHLRLGSRALLGRHAGRCGLRYRHTKAIDNTLVSHPSTFSYPRSPAWLTAATRACRLS